MRTKFYFLTLLITAGSCAQSNKNNAQQPAATMPELPLPALDFTDDIDTGWTETITRSDEEWKKLLTPEQFFITRRQGTERPFSSPLNDLHDEGLFFCVCCNNPLFSSKAKFNSGTGWPSFFTHYSSRSIHISQDNSEGMVRDELSCKRCGAHLGHVFNDGPKPTGLRYCIDGVALRFVPGMKEQGPLKKATFAGGCFWCEEATFEQVRGIREVVSGYSGGKTENPTYEEVGTGMTGHAESFEIDYDPSELTYAELLKVYMASIDPTQVNGQGPDIGNQYRSIIFYRTEEEKKQATDLIDSLNKSGVYKKPIAVELTRFKKFWKAEDYHQNYVRIHPENPYVRHESVPRMQRTKSAIPSLFK